MAVDRCHWLLIVAASLSIVAAHIQVHVHWSHGNRTGEQLPAREFAKLAEEARGETGIEKRNAIRDWSHLWYMGTVYYDIDARTADFRLLQILAPAFEFFKRYTCIRWKRKLPGNYEIRDYVIFSMPREGTKLCNSAVGKQTGRQYINLDTECVKSLAEVLHQMTHALGFYHMHSRPDRDKYIEVNPSNALPQNRRFFDKDSSKVVDTMGFPYEHKSLMHFDGFKYAVGSKPTIVSKVPGVLLGNKQALTVQDITMINTLYAQCKRACRFANGLCEHECFENKPGDVYCDCLKGYRLNGDKKTCFDVDECAAQNGGCDHICTPHGAWYKCECRPDFSLDKDGYTCRANDKCEDGSLRCQQDCLFNQCACRKGYILNKDGRTCDDIDECGEYDGGCEYKCFNTPGSFYCQCRKGAFVSNDGKSCTDLTCPTLSVVQNAQINCTRQETVEGTICQYSCNRGYKLIGEQETSCFSRKWSTPPPVCEATDRCSLDNGGCEQQCWANTWDDIKCSCKPGFKLQPDGISCKDIEPPTITKCPKDIYTNTVPKKSWASVTWDLPTYYDNVEASIVSGPVMQDKIGGVYDIGNHQVEYVIADAAGNKDSCSFKIKVLDVEKPDMFNCPKSRSFQASPLEKFIKADWEDPGFWDNSEVAVKVTTDLPADRHIDPRTQDIHYIATDPSGNSVVCTISITVIAKETSCDVFPYEPFGGYMKCDSSVFGKQCRPVCHNKYDLTQDGAAPIYLCQNRNWIPKPKQFECAVTQRPLKEAILYYEFTYKTPCTSSSVLSVTPYATAMATKNKRLLCPKTGDKCNLRVSVKCAGDAVMLYVYTSEPLSPPIPSRFLSNLKFEVMKQETGLFFYLPLRGVILPPQKDADGAKAIPHIELQCQDGAAADMTLLKCYAHSP